MECLAHSPVIVGAWDMDKHFRDAPFEQNIPVQLGLASIWNVSFLGYAARAILPYTQALSKLAPHIQQVQQDSASPSVPQAIFCQMAHSASCLVKLIQAVVEWCCWWSSAVVE